MKIKSAEFVQSAPDLRACPNWTRPEFAMIGRSNVGKSSLINSLTGRRQLAKISSTPGKTQLLNFFLVNDAWGLVDLPGYGYARVGERKRLEFNQAVASFIAQRNTLRTVFVLIDVRLPPQDLDLEFIAWLKERGRPAALIFTKADKQSAAQNRLKVEAFTSRLAAEGISLPDAFISSAETGAGRTEILAHIERVLAASHTRGVGPTSEA